MKIELNNLFTMLFVSGGFGFICGLLVAVIETKKKQN